MINNLCITIYIETSKKTTKSKQKSKNRELANKHRIKKMNYNNPNSSGAQFPYQYGSPSTGPNPMTGPPPQPPSMGAYGMPPQAPSTTAPGSMYPNLAGVGQQQQAPYGMPPQYPPPGAASGPGYPPQQPAYPQQQPYSQQPPYGGAGAGGYQQPYQQPYQQQPQHVNQQQYRPSYNAP